MDKIFDCIKQNYDFYVEKINTVAGYIVEKNFSMISYHYDDETILKIKNLGINISDFSPYVKKLCGDDYSKLLIIILFAFSVEV